jgi:aminotransferase
VKLSSRTSALNPSIIRDMFARRRATSIDLSLGEPAVNADAEVLERALAALRSGPQGYTDNAGLPELREAIARHHHLPERDRVENVIVTVGSEEAVFIAMIGTLDAGDEVLIPEPGYPAYRNIATLIGAVPVPYPIDRATGLVARADAIAARIGPKTRVLILNSPSNPFGTIDEELELVKIAALAESHELTVISDEIYRDLSYRAAPLPSIATMTSRALLISGLSKSCAMTGFRLGYLIADAALVKKMTLAHQLIATCAPRLSQLMAVEVFKDTRRLRAHVPYYEASRAALREAARALPPNAPMMLGDGAFYAILDISAYARGDSLAFAIELLDKEDVVAVPGIAFGPNGHWFLRLSYAAGAELAREGLTRIARFIESRSG